MVKQKFENKNGSEILIFTMINGRLLNEQLD